MWPVMLSFFALLIALYELFVCYRKPACFTVAALPMLRSVHSCVDIWRILAVSSTGHLCVCGASFRWISGGELVATCGDSRRFSFLILEE